MRKNVFFLLLLLLLLLTLSGCGDSIAPETEKVSLTALQYELENQTLDFDNMWFFQQIEEQTGVHVDFDVVKHSDWTNRVNLMFASGRYHDLILRGSLDVEDYGVTQHVILPLDDYLEEYMPTYFSRLPIDNAGCTLPSSDGKMYYVGFLLSQGINTNANIVLGLMLSNGLVALAGALLAQYQGSSDINMGRGAIVIGLAAVIIGEVIFGKLFHNIGAKLLAVSVGAIVYYIVLQVVLQIGLNTNDLKLITALIVAIFLTLSYLNLKKTRRKPKAQHTAKEGVEQHA